MKTRLFAALVGMLLAGTAVAFDPFVVSDIRVEGIQRIEAGTVFGYLPVKVGETMTEEKAAQAIRALFATGFFKDVRIEVEGGGVLIVAVEERPAIAQIDFVGMKEFPADQVKKALRENGIAEGRTFDKAVVDQAEQEIKRQYLTRGRYGVTIQTTVTPLDRNRVSLNFTIDEGDIAKIRQINIVGNQAFSEKDLLGIISLQPPNWISWYTKNDQYSRQKLQADLETLRSYYLNRGYLDFNIESTQVSITPDRRDIYITINLTEGDKYIVSSVKLGGDMIVPEEELLKLVTLKAGEPFSREKLTASTKAITDRLGNEGYAFANANAVPDVDKDKRTVAFTILVDPARRVYVRRIGIVGNTKTRDEVVRREMRQLEGAYYDGQKLQTSKRRIDRTGYFAEVDVDTEPVAGTTDQVDVTVKVKEKPTGNILLGLGYSSGDGLILQGSVQQQNLFGSGNALGIAANTSKVNRNLGLSFTKPYTTVDGLSTGFDIYSRRFNPQALGIANYITDTTGAGVRLGYPFSEVDRLDFSLTLENTAITTFSNSPARYIQYVETYGDSTNALVGSVAWVRDTRDSAIWTTSGMQQRLFGNYAFPGLDLKYYTVQYRATKFLPLSTDFTLALTGDVGYGAGYGGQPLPFFRNFYTGGATSVRGYQQSTLGPRDVNGVLGGQYKAVGNAELLFPMPGFGQDRSVRLGVFFDVGQVWSNLPGQQLSDIEGFRYSGGFSFSWISPFGPLKLLLGEPINSKPGDRIQRFQFLFGQTF